MIEIARYFSVPPVSDVVTAYDTRHWNLYWNLLDAEAEGAERGQMTAYFDNRRILHSQRPVIRLVESHLARAHWLCDRGLFLLW